MSAGKRVRVHAVAVVLALCALLDPVRAQAQDVRVTELHSGSTSVLQAISPVNDQTVWVSGHEGAILRSADGGDSWLSVPSPANDSLQFRDIHAFGWESAVILSAGEGALSRIYRTDDAGLNWTTQFVMDDPRGFLDCLAFWDEDRGFAYGDSFDGRLFILVTDDGGRQWRRPPAVGTNGATQIPEASEGEGGFAASGSCAQVGPDGRGWIGTGAGAAPRLLESDDFGLTWRATPVPLASGGSAGLFTIAMANGSPAMLLGGDLSTPDDVTPNVAMSPDGGATWRRSPTASPIPGAVYGSAAPVVDGSVWVFGFAPPGAAYTRDGGAAWLPIENVSAWAAAFGPSGHRGWAVGGQGRIWRLDIVR
ncbi:MAG: WD40/YVTN/BNR-like repeat-containing protein [Longimicrobiales bacterium]